ncbi:MAG: signal peptidase I [Rickettsiales bacterium]|jgi:signal peptidase I|nr:signal peptidase I [Rickettsiales bacterium]
MKKKYTSTTREWVNTLVWAGLIAIVFRSFLLEPFNIPSGSMIPTLQVGDHIFVTKWSYGYSRNSFPFGSWNMWDGRFLSHEPKTGDVIVFRKPNDTVDYVKRLIGLPGDTVQMVGGRLYINGQMVERENPRPYIIANLAKRLRSAGFQRMNTKTGDVMIIKGNKIYVNNRPADFNYTIEYKPDRLCDISPVECMVIDATEWTEILPNGVRHSIVEISDDRDYDNTPLFKVPDRHFFMMGDDRDLSRDSRADVGFVPRDNILGRVWFVWYSHNYYAPLVMLWTWPEKLRWDRIGMGIN